MSTGEFKVRLPKPGFFPTALSYVAGQIMSKIKKPKTTLGDVFNALPTEPMSPEYRVQVIETAIFEQFLSERDYQIFIDSMKGIKAQNLNGLMLYDYDQIDTLMLSLQGISPVNQSKIKIMLMNESSPILSMKSMLQNMGSDMYQKVKAKVLPTQSRPPEYSALLTITMDESHDILSIINMVQNMEPVGFLASNGQIEWANKAALDALGMTLDALIGKNILDVTHNYGLSDVRKNQILNGDFEPYEAIFCNEKTRTEIPVRIQPGPIDGKRTFGIITIIKPGNSLFSEKDQQREYEETLQVTFLMKKSELLNNNPLTAVELLNIVKDFSRSDGAFLAFPAVGGWDVRITGKDNMPCNDMKSLLTYFENNPFLYFSEIAHPLKKHIEVFLPNSEKITSGFLVPIRNEKGEITDIIGVTSNDKPLFPNINSSVVSVWFQYFGQLSQKIRLSK